MNKVFLTGRLTRDPELRSLASGKAVTTFSLATNEYPGGKERTEYHNVVTWDRLAEICGQFLGKGQQVAIEGRIQTRSLGRREGGPPLEDRDRRLQRRDAVGSQEEGLRGPVGGRGPRGSATAGPGDDDDDPSYAASREGSAADPLPVEAAA